jgi:exosortase/archaeosortase family protein
MSGVLLGNLKAQKIHFLIGLAFSLLLMSVVAFNIFNFRIWQTNIIDGLLSFAGVPHRFFYLPNIAQEYFISTGPTFEIPVHYTPISSLIVVILLSFFALAIILVNLSKKIPPPLKAACSIISFLSILTLVWNSFVSPIPSYNLHWITVDWSCSGVISIFLIILIFVPFLFTIKGPYWVKFFWLFIALGFSLIWNLIRLSFVTATLYHFGGIPFLLSHYLIGAFIDFIYVVTFYSLALSHLSKYEVIGYGGLDN